MALYQLVYLSQRSPDCKAQDLQKLLEHARDFNAQNNLTGILMHSDTHFFQYLEGEQTDVLTLYKKIKNDTRHSGVITVSSGNIEHRAFAGWDMRSDLLTEEAAAKLNVSTPDMFMMLWQMWCKAEAS